MSCPWSQTIDSGVPGRDERNSSHARAFAVGAASTFHSRPLLWLVAGADNGNEISHPLRDSLPGFNLSIPGGLSDVRPHPHPLRHIRVGVATSDVDERSRDLTDQVLELGRRSRSLVWGDVILALSASFVRRACPAHRAEEPVIGTI